MSKSHCLSLKYPKISLSSPHARSRSRYSDRNTIWGPPCVVLPRPHGNAASTERPKQVPQSSASQAMKTSMGMSWRETESWNVGILAECKKMQRRTKEVLHSAVVLCVLCTKGWPRRLLVVQIVARSFRTYLPPSRPLRPTCHGSSWSWRSWSNTLAWQSFAIAVLPLFLFLLFLLLLLVAAVSVAVILVFLQLLLLFIGACGCDCIWASRFVTTFTY